MTYRASTIKRTRRTKAQIEQLDRQIIEVLAADHPQSVRHVFYRMTDPRLPEPVEKSDRGYRHVQHRCVELRRSGAIPYGWIADATRRGYFTPTYANAGDFVKRMNAYYRADLWADAHHYVEVWTESRSIASVLQEDCADLAVSLYPCGGFSSISFAHDAAEYVNNNVDDYLDMIVIYIGDHDPAGVLIDGALERELRTHLDPDRRMTFRRLAITQEQIALYDLPTKPRKASDKRALHIDVAVEAESMPAHVLRRLVRDAVEDYLPADALEVTKVAEESERNYLMQMAAIMSARGQA